MLVCMHVSQGVAKRKRKRARGEERERERERERKREKERETIVDNHDQRQVLLAL